MRVSGRGDASSTCLRANETVYTRIRNAASVSGCEQLLLSTDGLGGSVVLFEVTSEMCASVFVFLFVLFFVARRGLMVTRYLQYFEISQYVQVRNHTQNTDRLESRGRQEMKLLIAFRCDTSPHPQVLRGTAWTQQNA